MRLIISKEDEDNGWHRGRVSLETLLAATNRTNGCTTKRMIFSR